MYRSVFPGTATNGSKRKVGQRGDGRWLTAAMVVAYFCAINLLALVLGCNLSVIWNLLGVPALPQHFHDLRDIAVGIGRFEAARHPWNSATIAYSVEAFSYPKWWLGLAFLGLNLDTFYFFGLGFALLYFVCALFVLGRIGLVEGLVAGFLLVSPAVMTCIERGNGDLVIFALLALALAQRRSLAITTGCITSAAFLKLYPAAALLAVVKFPWRKTLPWLVAALSLFGIDLMTSSHEIHQVSVGILPEQRFSFGSTPIWIGLQKAYPTTFDYTGILALGSLCYVVVLAVSIWARPRVSIKPEWERHLFAFRIGASLFIGTFALGTNYDYRTALLVFCLPLLFVLTKERGVGYVWAVTALASIILYTNCYLFFHHAYGAHLQFFIKQLIGWGVLSCLSALLAGTFPGFPVVGKDERSTA